MDQDHTVDCSHHQSSVCSTYFVHLYRQSNIPLLSKNRILADRSQHTGSSVAHRSWPRMEVGIPRRCDISRRLHRHLYRVSRSDDRADSLHRSHNCSFVSAVLVVEQITRTSRKKFQPNGLLSHHQQPRGCCDHFMWPPAYPQLATPRRSRAKGKPERLSSRRVFSSFAPWPRRI